MEKTSGLTLNTAALNVIRLCQVCLELSRHRLSNVVILEKSSRALCDKIRVEEGIVDEQRQSQNLRIITGIEFG